MTEEFKREQPKIEKPEPVKVEKPKAKEPKAVEAPWEAKLKVASAKAVAREFKRRGWKTAADIRDNFKEAKQVFVQLNVQNLLAAIKEGD